VPGTGLEPASREAADFKYCFTVRKHRLLACLQRKIKGLRASQCCICRQWL